MTETINQLDPGPFELVRTDLAFNFQPSTFDRLPLGTHSSELRATRRE